MLWITWLACDITNGSACDGISTLDVTGERSGNNFDNNENNDGSIPIRWWWFDV